MRETIAGAETTGLHHVTSFDKEQDRKTIAVKQLKSCFEAEQP